MKRHKNKKEKYKKWREEQALKVELCREKRQKGAGHKREENLGNRV